MLLTVDQHEKIKESIDLIRKGETLAFELNPEYGYHVAFSGGKDSVVLLDLVQKAKVPYRAVYNVTTNDPPENVYFIRKHYPKVVFDIPKENYFSLVSRKGMPTIRKRYCCAILKETKGAGKVVLTGVRAQESKKRAGYDEVMINSRRKEHLLAPKKKTLDDIMKGQHRCIKGKDSIMMLPIFKWTEKDVWDYITYFNLPINPCYKVSDRVGCMFCPFTHRDELEFYERYYPKYKDRLLQSIQTFLDSRKPFKPSEFRDANEYYDWWKSKRSYEDWRKTHVLSSISSEKKPLCNQ